MKYFVFPFLVLIFIGCGDPSVNMKKKQAAKVDVKLDQKDIFNGVKINQYLANEIKFVSESHEYFLKAIDSYKNKNDLDSAVHYFYKSILKEPSSNAYYELGNVYKEKGLYKEAVSSYKLAEQLDYQPFCNILYNLSSVYSLMENTELSGQYLIYSLQAGFTDIERIEKDPSLEYLREQNNVSSILKKGLRGTADPKTLAWLQFKKQFSATNLPLEISFLNEGPNQELNFISYDFERFVAEMRDEKFSREVGKGFYYHAIPIENEKYVAVTYIIREEFLGDWAPNTYRLATFTHSGKLIDKKIIAGGEEIAGPLKEAMINQDGSIEINVFEPVFEKDINEHGFYQNPIIGKNQLGKESYTISENGKIVANDPVAVN